MGEFINGLNTAGGAFVGWAGHMLLQSSVLIVILAALDLVLRKRVKAVVRYGIWLLVLAKLLLPPSLSSPTSPVAWMGSRLPQTPLVSVTHDSPVVVMSETVVAEAPARSSGVVPEKVSVASPERVSADLPARISTEVPERVSVAASASGDTAALPRPAEGPASMPKPEPTSLSTSAAPTRPVALPTWQALVLLAWMVAVLVMGVLLLQRVAFVHGLMAQAQEAPHALQTLLEQCRRQMGVRGRVGIRLTGLSASPSVCGLWRPVILMPEPMVRQLGTTGLRSVLFHELAHLQRGDLWINLLQTLLQIVYLYHPLLWWANARIRAVREQAVDETVLAALGEEAEEYPETLLCLSKLAFGQPALSLRLLGVVESEKALIARIEHMVSRPFPQNARFGRLGLAALLVAAVVLLPMARGTKGGQRATPSVADRVQREDDPELADLIRAAAANHQGASEQEVLEITRRVTAGRAQVLLLDQQIEEAARQIAAASGPEETRRQLLQTRKELEAKRMAEMGSLRAVMGIVPRLAFDKQPTAKLNAWVSLHVLEQRVVVLDRLKGFTDYWAMARHQVVGVLSEKETLDYVRGRLQDKKSLPIRISISYVPETNQAAADLRQKVCALAREMHADMDAEVPLELATWVGNGTATFFLREGQITTLYPDPVQRPAGGPKLLATGRVDLNDLEQHILWRLTMPRNLPLTYRIEYDEASSKLAKQVADTVKAVAKRIGLAEVVNVAGALVEPTPETPFVGRWQALVVGEMQTLEIQAGGVCQATMGKGTAALKAGTKVTGSWFMTTQYIVVDLHDKTQDRSTFLYRGEVNADGRLVINRVNIYPQGMFALSGPSETTFQRMK